MTTRRTVLCTLVSLALAWTAVDAPAEDSSPGDFQVRIHSTYDTPAEAAPVEFSQAGTGYVSITDATGLSGWATLDLSQPIGVRLPSSPLLVNGELCQSVEAAFSITPTDELPTGEDPEGVELFYLQPTLTQVFFDAPSNQNTGVWDGISPDWFSAPRFGGLTYSFSSFAGPLRTDDAIEAYLAAHELTAPTKFEHGFLIRVDEDIDLGPFGPVVVLNTDGHDYMAAGVDSVVAVPMHIGSDVGNGMALEILSLDTSWISVHISGQLRAGDNFIGVAQIGSEAEDLSSTSSNPSIVVSANPQPPAPTGPGTCEPPLPDNPPCATLPACVPAAPELIGLADPGSVVVTDLGCESGWMWLGDKTCSPCTHIEIPSRKCIIIKGTGATVSGFVSGGIGRTGLFLSAGVSIAPTGKIVGVVCPKGIAADRGDCVRAWTCWKKCTHRYQFTIIPPYDGSYSWPIPIDVKTSCVVLPDDAGGGDEGPALDGVSRCTHTNCDDEG